MFDPETIIQTGGLLAIALIVFAECGILLGLFLPGDTLLVTAGLFAGQGKLSLDWLIILTIVATVAGYQVGYIFGERLGPKLFTRRDGILLRREYIEKTRHFFDKYGPVTLLLARFIAHVRTFVSVIAGAAGMNKRVFFVFNVLGGVLWVVGLVMLGYWLGANVPNIDRFFFPIVVGGLVIFYAIALWGIVKNPARRHNVKKGLKEDFNYFFRRGNI